MVWACTMKGQRGLGKRLYKVSVDRLESDVYQPWDAQDLDHEERQMRDGPSMNPGNTAIKRR